MMEHSLQQSEEEIVPFVHTTHEYVIVPLLWPGPVFLYIERHLSLQNDPTFIGDIQLFVCSQDGVAEPM
jgi:hypothetical protein